MHTLLVSGLLVRAILFVISYSMTKPLNCCSLLLLPLPLLPVAVPAAKKRSYERIAHHTTNHSVSTAQEKQTSR